MPVSGCLPGLLFARRVMPQLSSVAWKSLFLWSNFSWKRAQENVNEYWKIHMAENSKRASGFIYRSSEYLIHSGSKQKGWLIHGFRNPCYKWSSYSWGIMFAQRQLEAFEKIWQRQPVHSVHLWPSLCLSNWGCNLSCNPSHFCLCLCCWDSHLGTTKLKFTFLYKRRTWIVVNLRAIPIHVAPGPSPIQREHE